MRTISRFGLVCGLALAASTMVHAGTVNINFSALSYGTTDTSGPGVNFSLSNPSGAPAIGYFSGPQTGLTNTTSGGYPTSEYLYLNFTAGVSDVSFTFNNWGDGNGTNFTAYSGSTVVDSGLLDEAPYDSSVGYGLVDVTGSDITSIVFDNATGGSANWVYAVGDLSYTPAVPEPGTLSLFGTGLVGLCGLFRRKLSRNA